MRTLLVLVCALLEIVKGFVLSPLALARTQQKVSAYDALATDRHAQACVCMSCRNNLKKEKRARNRVNAYRFKKGGFTKKRFNNFEDRAVVAQKASEDAAFLSMIFTQTAEAEAEAAAAAKDALKEAQAAPAAAKVTQEA